MSEKTETPAPSPQVVWLVHHLDEDFLNDIRGGEGWEWGQNTKVWASAELAKRDVEIDVKADVEEWKEDEDYEELKNKELKWEQDPHGGWSIEDPLGCTWFVVPVPLVTA